MFLEKTEADGIDLEKDEFDVSDIKERKRKRRKKPPKRIDQVCLR